MARDVDIDAVRPTVLYLDAAELAAEIGAFDFGDPDREPLPAYRHRGDVYLAEGHARAFVAYLAGEHALRVDTEAEFGADEMRLYRERMSWCFDAGVDRLADLSGRVVSTETFVEEWVDRCRRTTDRLAEG